MKIQASIEFLLIASAIAVLCLSAVSLYGKTLFNQTKGLASMSNASQQGIFMPIYGAGFEGAAPYSTKIEGRNESTAYGLGAPVSVVNLTSISHCTNFDFYGKPLDVKGQCGASDAWEYRVDYGKCPSTAAYCEFHSDTGYSILNTQGNRNYRYNFTLLLYSYFGVMQASLSNTKNNSPVMLANTTVGHARVLMVGSSEQVQVAPLLCSNNICSLLNQTLYAQYSQWKNAAYSMLAYYNSTPIDPVTQSSVLQTLSSFIRASKALRNGVSGTAPCEIRSSDYVCSVSFPFYYTIKVNLSRSFSMGEQTSYYMGSSIEVIGD